MSIHNFTKQSGGLPKRSVNLPKGSGLPKNSGGLGGNSKYISYPNWIRDEIHGSIKQGGTGILNDSDFSSASGDDSPAPPKTEREAEKEHERKFVRKGNNEIAREEGLPSDSDSETSDPETKEKIRLKLAREEGDEFTEDLASVDLDELTEGREGLTEDIFSIFQTTPNTQRQIREALKRTTPPSTKARQKRGRVSLSAQKPPKPSQLRGRHDTTPFRLPQRLTRQAISQPSPSTLDFASFAVSPVIAEQTRNKWF